MFFRILQYSLFLLKVAMEVLSNSYSTSRNADIHSLFYSIYRLIKFLNEWRASFGRRNIIPYEKDCIWGPPLFICLIVFTCLQNKRLENEWFSHSPWYIPFSKLWNWVSDRFELWCVKPITIYDLYLGSDQVGLKDKFGVFSYEKALGMRQFINSKVWILSQLTFSK